MPDVISEEVKRFIIDHIDSVAELEILLFLREHRDRGCSSDSIADHIYSDAFTTSELLAKLVNRGLVTTDGRAPASFRYGPHNHELARLLDQLAEAYAKYLVPVTNLVHKKSRRNIEGVAEAFNLKRKK